MFSTNSQLQYVIRNILYYSLSPYGKYSLPQDGLVKGVSEKGWPSGSVSPLRAVLTDWSGGRFL